MDVTQGEHVNPDNFEAIPAGELGSSKQHPFLTMPARCEVPYGAWFRCHKCSRLCRSTITFDCYGEEGEPLLCEACSQAAGDDHQQGGG